MAKLLSFESLDITLIDTDKERLNYAESHLDIKGIKGDASSVALMQEAQVENSDLFIAVTAEEATISFIGSRIYLSTTMVCVSKPGMRMDNCW